jgi:hypothetical protein
MPIYTVSIDTDSSICDVDSDGQEKPYVDCTDIIIKKNRKEHSYITLYGPNLEFVSAMSAAITKFVREHAAEWEPVKLTIKKK